VSRTIAVPTVILALGSAVALAACGSAASSKIASAAPTAITPPASSSTQRAPATAARSSSGSGTTAASNAPSLNASSSTYGKVLFDRAGRVLYTFAPDRANASTCYGGCAAAWPPFTVNRAPKAGAGVRSSLLGTTRRRDGSLQVTYAGHPLYYFTGDRKPGQITCQNVSSFGGLWLVINPNGTPVH
jgi:predicted lipoprotein with Yx(FWY)xxD motif